MEVSIQVGFQALRSSLCQGLGVGTRGRLLAQHPGASPQHHSLCQGISVVITSKWQWAGEGAPSSCPRNALTQDGREGFSISSSSFQEGPVVEHETPASLSIICNTMHVHKQGGTAQSLGQCQAPSSDPGAAFTMSANPPPPAPPPEMTRCVF